TAGKNHTNMPNRRSPTRRQKKGKLEATATNQKTTSASVRDALRNEIHTTRPNQAHIGRNQRMFCHAVTLPIQSLRMDACKSTAAAIGLTRPTCATAAASAGQRR